MSVLHETFSRVVRARLFLRLVLTVSAVIAVNVIGFIVAKDAKSVVTRQDGFGGVIVDSTPLDRTRYVLATAENEILLVENDVVVRSKSFEHPILSIAASEDAKRIYVGCTDQRIYILDRNFQDAGLLTVQGRIKDIDAMSNGGLLVVYGTGEYSDKWYLSRFTPEYDEVFRYRIGFNSKAVVSIGEDVFFGTRNSRVGMVSESGKEMWRITLIKPIERLVALASRNSIAVSDEGGNVHLLDSESKIIWHTEISAYSIRSLAWHRPSLSLLAGDESGRFYLMNGQGKLIYENRVFTQGVRSLVITGDDTVSLVSYSGEQATISIAAALRGRTHRFVRTMRAWLTLIGSLLTAGLLTASVSSLRTKVAVLRKRLYEGRVGYLLVLPSLLLLLAFAYYPAISGLYYSLTDFSLSNPIEFVGFENFAAAMHDRVFISGFRNMGIILAANLFKVVSFPLLTALLVFHLVHAKPRNFFKTAFIVPSIVPGIVIVLIWRMIYGSDVGLINQILELLGLAHLKQAWLGNGRYALGSIIFAGFPWVGAFAFLIYFGGLINISGELYDAARIDGANAVARFVRIELPLLKPQFGILIFFSYIGSIQSYADIFVFTRGGPGYATYVPGLQMYLEIADRGNYGYASSLGVILFIIVFVVTVLLRMKRKEA